MQSKAIRVADGHNPFAQGSGVANTYGHKVSGIDADHRQIGVRIIAHHPGGEVTTVGERDLDLVGVVHPRGCW